jgi:hypothetical protein
MSGFYLCDRGPQPSAGMDSLPLFLETNARSNVEGCANKPSNCRIYLSITDPARLFACEPGVACCCRASLQALAKVRNRWSKPWPAFAFLSGICEPKRRKSWRLFHCGFKKRDGIIGAGFARRRLQQIRDRLVGDDLTDRDIIDIHCRENPRPSRPVGGSGSGNAAEFGIDVNHDRTEAGG